MSLLVLHGCDLVSCAQDLGRHAIDVGELTRHGFWIEDVHHTRIDLRQRSDRLQRVQDRHALIGSLCLVERADIFDIDHAAMLTQDVGHRWQDPGMSQDVDLALDQRA